MCAFNCCCKFFLSVLYLFLWVASATLIYIGSRTLILVQQYEQVSQSTHIKVSALCILAAGLLLFAITVIGLLAYCKRSRVLLIVFYSMLMIVLLCEIGAILMAVFHWSALEDNVRKVLRMELDTYSKESRFEVDQVQSTLHCCGIDSYYDWNQTAYFKANHDYPPSCCPSDVHIMLSSQKDSDSNSTIAPVAPTCTPYPIGCLTVLSEQFHAKLTLIIAIGVIFVLFQVLGLHGSCILLCHSQPVTRWEEQQYVQI